MTTLQTILDKLIKRESDLNTLLLQTQALLDDNSSPSFKLFISNELHGYEDPETIPSHRQIKASIYSRIVNHYGYTEIVPVAVHTISEKLKFDLELIYMPDNIGFIETNYAELRDDEVFRKFSPSQQNLLQDLVSNNNPDTQLLETYYKFPRVHIKQLIEGVRARFIELIQNEIKHTSKNESESLKGVKAVKLNTQIKVFVTYAWEDEEHNGLVKSFTDLLRKQGYDATMDVKESQQSTSINFSRMMIDNLTKADKVVTILSPKYCKKADDNTGGVAFEFNMIVNDMKDNPKKYIFAHFGKQDRDQITPYSIKGTDILNLKEDQDNNFNNLHAKLQSINTIEFSEVNETLPSIKQEKIKPFKL